jgi:hypothetical protein
MDEDNRQHQDSDAEHAPKEGRTPQILQAPSEETITQEQQSRPADNRQTMSTYERSSRRIQGFIALVTTIYVIFAGLQWHAMKETLDFAAENIGITRQTVRAWLVISKIERTSDFAANTPITFNMKLKNVGPSTAQNMLFDMADWICDGPPSMGCASQCPSPLPRDQVQGDTIVGPQGEPFVEILISPQRQEVIDAIKSGAKTAYFCGTVTYKDVFLAPHMLNVCAYYMPKLDKFAACPVGNSDT